MLRYYQAIEQSQMRCKRYSRFARESVNKRVGEGSRLLFPLFTQNIMPWLTWGEIAAILLPTHSYFKEIMDQHLTVGLVKKSIEQWWGEKLFEHMCIKLVAQQVNSTVNTMFASFQGIHYSCIDKPYYLYDEVADLHFYVFDKIINQGNFKFFYYFFKKVK